VSRTWKTWWRGGRRWRTRKTGCHGGRDSIWTHAGPPWAATPPMSLPVGSSPRPAPPPVRHQNGSMGHRLLLLAASMITHLRYLFCATQVGLSPRFAGNPSRFAGNPGSPATLRSEASLRRQPFYQISRIRRC
jgi:hypothetical protein